MKDLVLLFFRGWHRSYTQIFFSDHPVCAALLIGASFINPNIGFSGLIAVTVTNLIALLLGFDRYWIANGVYGFNSLLVGFGLGAFYEITPEMTVFLSLAAILTFIITIACIQIFNRFSLPVLSVPFVLTYWLVALAGRQFQSLDLSQHGIYMINEVRRLGGDQLLSVYESIHALDWPPLLSIYFHSLGAIIFQHEIIAGILIAIGLLIASRIAFVLSWIGFLSGWLFYGWIGGDRISELEYGYIGFNFILSAIAVGGFFYTPSLASYLLSSLIAPVNAILIASFSTLLILFQLPLVSLPFNLSVLLIMSALAWRPRYDFLLPVFYPLYSPEKNLYAYLNRTSRFHHRREPIMTLPFFGSWTITQGHHGEQTHRDQWRHAWDFEIADEEGKTYTKEGSRREDYYCYGLPIIAPADGWVEEIIDHIEDNLIGEMNLTHNWGNSVVLRHENGLYTQLSHLQPFSIRVTRQSFVRRGDLIGYCGNSGRSPVPHLHFQIQNEPAIGSPTMEWPISYFISSKSNQYRFHTFEIPKANETITNVEIHPLLRDAYHFIPGSRLLVQTSSVRQKEPLVWEIKTDMSNRTYFHCLRSQSYAYFLNDGITFQFTDFYGDRNSVLYHFYIANYKILLGFYPDLVIEDEPSLSDYPFRPWFWLHDFTAPFFQYLRFRYRHRHVRIDHPVRTAEIELHSEARLTVLNHPVSCTRYLLWIRNHRLAEMHILKPWGKKLCVSFLPES